MDLGRSLLTAVMTLFSNVNYNTEDIPSTLTMSFRKSQAYEPD